MRDKPTPLTPASTVTPLAASTAIAFNATPGKPGAVVVPVIEMPPAPTACSVFVVTEFCV
jgi:hypothetical protein